MFSQSLNSAGPRPFRRIPIQNFPGRRSPRPHRIRRGVIVARDMLPRRRMQERRQSEDRSSIVRRCSLCQQHARVSQPSFRVESRVPSSVRAVLAMTLPASKAAIPPAAAVNARLHRPDGSAPRPRRDLIPRLGAPSGKRAIITGGDSGIGRAVAIAYAREGADLLISYLDEEADAAETKRWVEKESRKAVLVPGDIQSAVHCRAIVEAAMASRRDRHSRQQRCPSGDVRELG